MLNNLQLPAKGTFAISTNSKAERGSRMRFETVKRIEGVLKLADDLREQIKLELQQGDAPLQTAQASRPPVSLPRVEAFPPHWQTPMGRVHDFQ